ncbi:hypothetical protein LDENG_00259750 [Lucifuga dentata]|nr:hypothetical protein LDENG_00259750 [Lucifuga dentata]
MNRVPVDYDYLLYFCTQEMQVFQAATAYLSVPVEVFNSLQHLIDIINSNVTHTSGQPQPSSDVDISFSGYAGRPRLEISSDALQSLLDTSLPVGHLAALQGISRRTFYRQMKDYNMSVRKRYTNITDEDLDERVRIIKTHMPNAG